jgi:hypothetical protein
MITYTATPPQAAELIETGYCHIDIPQTHARPADGQNVIVCDRTCHVVSVVDDRFGGMMRVYLRRGVK